MIKFSPNKSSIFCIRHVSYELLMYSIFVIMHVGKLSCLFVKATHKYMYTQTILVVHVGSAFLFLCFTCIFSSFVMH